MGALARAGHRSVPSAQRVSRWSSSTEALGKAAPQRPHLRGSCAVLVPRGFWRQEPGHKAALWSWLPRGFPLPQVARCCRWHSIAGISFPDSPHSRCLSDRGTRQLFTCWGGASSVVRLGRQPEVEPRQLPGAGPEGGDTVPTTVCQTLQKEAMELPGGIWGRCGRERAGPAHQGPARTD